MSGPAPNVLTVDVEEWFHICGVGGELAPHNWTTLPSRVVLTTNRLLDLLDRTQVRATFFVLGYVAERHPELIERIGKAGHEIGSHGYLHERVYELTADAFESDLDRSARAIESCGVPGIVGYRAPEWSINDRSLWALSVLARKGFRFDSSMAPMRVVGNPSYPREPHRRQTPSGAIVECPPAVTTRLGQTVPFGGGWGLRMTEPRTVLHALEARAHAGNVSVFWVHPWELDDDPPVVRLPAARRFAHYFRLHQFGRRLETILRGATFGPLGPVAFQAGR